MMKIRGFLGCRETKSIFTWPYFVTLNPLYTPKYQSYDFLTLHYAFWHLYEHFRYEYAVLWTRKTHFTCVFARPTPKYKNWRKCWKCCFYMLFMLWCFFHQKLISIVLKWIIVISYDTISSILAVNYTALFSWFTPLEE